MNTVLFGREGLATVWHSAAPGFAETWLVENADPCLKNRHFRQREIESVAGAAE